jgi:hypothetical protein
VTDPETGESLGNWELVKGRLVAAHVQERMTVCAPEPGAGAAGGEADPSTNVLSAKLVRDSMSRAPAEKLNVNRSEVSGMPSAKPIAVGDRVRSVGD